MLSASLSRLVWREKIANFYLRKESGGRLAAIPFVIGETAVKKPAWILYGQYRRSLEKLSEEMKKFDGSLVFPLSGYEGHAAGVYLVK